MRMQRPTPCGARTLLSAALPLLFAVNTAANFTYNNFASTSGIQLVGSAAHVGTRVRLTPAAGNQAGGAWYETKQSVASGFDTSFEFQLSTGGADGFAFLVQNASSAALGNTGCGLGYDGVANSLAIEFDTYTNSTCNGSPALDPSAIHVSVHSRGLSPNIANESASLASTVTVPNFADDTVHPGRIVYQAGLLSIYLDDPIVPVLSVMVDLTTLLALDAGRAWVGFTASTGGVSGIHDLVSWTFDEIPPVTGNNPPAVPLISEPASDGLTLNPADVHMETGPFSDPDAGDQHDCTDWEIWTISPSQRIWITSCATGVERVHTHLGDGVFENSHAGRSELLANTNYRLRARHSDDSADPVTQWSAWSQRTFRTGNATQVYPLALQDVGAAPVPRWVVAGSESSVILSRASTPPSLRLESAAGDLLLGIVPSDGTSNAVTNPATLASHVSARLQIQGGTLGLTLPATDLRVVDDHCMTHSILLPALTIAPGTARYYWISVAGATYVGTSTQTAPSFATLARGLFPPWAPRQQGFHVEVFATGFQLPVNIAFVPAPGPGPNDPFFYVTELYGTIKVVKRNGTVGIYAGGLLNFSPTGAFPGSGEQGLTGIAVDPATGNVYAAMLYAPTGSPSTHFPKIVRFTSTDGGLTAATQTTILDMLNETQGQSHQISNLTITSDGKLLCHMGDGFTTATAQNLDSYRGKILRTNLDGSPVPGNPFYDAGNGLTARDSVYAYGVRNPFGGAWRAADDHHYVVENGPSVDRFARIVPGRNYGWNGSDASMANFAIYTWNPSRGPVNLVFVQPETFGGSGFPASSMGHAFVSESGPTYATGPQTLGKRITEWILDANGNLVSGPIPFLEYAGNGKATACGLEAGPDGLYMTELYNDSGGGATAPGARILRISFDPSDDCNANGQDDACDIAGGTSGDANGNWVPDDCECAGTTFCQAIPNSTGQAAHISSNGACVVAANNLVLSAGPVPNQVGIFFYGPNQVNGGSGQPFYDGFRCVGSGPIHRLPIVSSAGNVATLALDFNQLAGSAAIAPGSSWHFQYWFRDSAAGASGANLSDALAITFH